MPLSVASSLPLPHLPTTLLWRPLSCHSALPLAAQPHSHWSPGCHFVILGEYNLASGAEPLQVCPSCAWAADGKGRVGSAGV